MTHKQKYIEIAKLHKLDLSRDYFSLSDDENLKLCKIAELHNIRHRDIHGWTIPQALYYKLQKAAN